MKDRVTIRDVARQAGVSLGTASRALNRTGRVSEEAIAAVTQAARQLGYRPDAVARSMRTRSSGVIGLLVSDLANPLYAQIITAAETAFQAAGYSLLVANTHSERKRETSLIELFRGRRVDGLILGPCEKESPELLEQLSRELPVVALDREFGQGCSGVQVDHYAGALQATQYVLNLGHTRVALLTPASDLRTGKERIAGFRRAFEERGLTPLPNLIRAEQSAMEFAFSEAMSLLSFAERPTAFICLGTRILAGVLQAIRHMGHTVPGDVSVISIGDTDLSRLFSPTITSLNWDLDVVGTCAAQLIFKQLDRKSQTPSAERIVVKTQLILRESCGPVTTQA
ncbi:LacI family transcriptional regulator [Verticiella sediminum]|uniref:LacI family transcriptional regulator n=1 Tax=Verticiella sediminum TaxID=1247510 RepID=A0A556AXM6_9BURK|nr:substrate-binding domain-containing protein [Verticiella sediminum]TSH97672.1 LacI family transcriptional regulator [Verticiella sediminum]